MAKDKLEVDCESPDEQTLECKIKESGKLIAELKVGEGRVKFTAHDKGAVLRNMKELGEMGKQLEGLEGVHCSTCNI